MLGVEMRRLLNVVDAPRADNVGTAGKNIQDAGSRDEVK